MLKPGKIDKYIPHVITMMYVSFIFYYQFPQAQKLFVLLQYLSAIFLLLLLYSSHLIKLSLSKITIVIIALLIAITSLSVQLFYQELALSIFTVMLNIGVITLLGAYQKEITVNQLIIHVVTLSFLFNLVFYTFILRDISGFSHSENHFSVIFLTTIIMYKAFTKSELPIIFGIIWVICFFYSGSFSNVIVGLCYLIGISYKHIRKIWMLPLFLLFLITFYEKLISIFYQLMSMAFATEVFLSLAIGSLSKRFAFYLDFLGDDVLKNIILGHYYSMEVREQVGISLHNSFLHLNNNIGFWIFIILLLYLRKFLYFFKISQAHTIIIVTVFLLRGMIDTIFFTYLFMISIVFAYILRVSLREES